MFYCNAIFFLQWFVRPRFQTAASRSSFWLFRGSHWSAWFVAWFVALWRFGACFGGVVWGVVCGVVCGGLWRFVAWFVAWFLAWLVTCLWRGLGRKYTLAVIQSLLFFVTESSTVWTQLKSSTTRFFTLPKTNTCDWILIICSSKTLVHITSSELCGRPKLSRETVTVQFHCNQWTNPHDSHPQRGISPLVASEIALAAYKISHNIWVGIKKVFDKSPWKIPWKRAKTREIDLSSLQP